MPEQAQSAERPNEEQSDEWLDQIVSGKTWYVFLTGSPIRKEQITFDRR